MRVDFRFLVGLVGILAFADCNSSSGTGGGGGPAVTPDQQYVGTYMDDGSNLIVTSQDTSRRCEGNTLVVTPDPTPSVDTIPYTFNGNTLTAFPPDFVDSISPGVLVGYGLVMTRVGSGNGLQGSWQVTDFTYRVVSGGSLSAQDQITVNATLVQERSDLSANSWTVQITATGIFSTRDAGTAQDFLDGNWYSPSLPDPLIYNITAVATGKYTVQLTGGTSGEVVTLTLSPNKDVAYSSSVTGNTVHYYYHDPRSCPNADQPDWYTQFLAANLN